MTENYCLCEHYYGHLLISDPIEFSDSSFSFGFADFDQEFENYEIRLTGAQYFRLVTSYLRKEFKN